MGVGEGGGVRGGGSFVQEKRERSFIKGRKQKLEKKQKITQRAAPTAQVKDLVLVIGRSMQEARE